MRGRSTWLPSWVTAWRSAKSQPGRENRAGVSKWVSSTMAASWTARAAGLTLGAALLTAWAVARVGATARAAATRREALVMVRTLDWV